MFLYRSNRSERLVDELADVLRRPQASPFAPELIVVQSKGMERFLSLELSVRLGVFANAQFPFPRHLLERMFDAVLGDPPETAAAFDESTLLWVIAALLPEQLGDPAFLPIARYLQSDADGALRIQLAERLARVLDNYAVYRPDLLAAWERGEEQGWEARLWRAVVARQGRGYQAARAQRLVAALREGVLPPGKLPQRLCLFGISSLPPLYVSVLAALAEHVEMHLFVLSPSREYFGDVRGRRMRLADEAPERGGHPLLDSLGRLGREFQDVLEEHTQYRETEADLYVDPGHGSLLHTLQSDILGLRNRGAAGDSAPRARLLPDDRSVEVRICHGAMREVEVLHDQLSEILEDTRIEPHEIVVMTPQIEAYAPVIDAVFGQRGNRPQLPFSVADRRPRSSIEVVDALYALTEVLQGRMSASSVLDLLSFDCIRRRFDIAVEELEALRAWVKDSGVRWGVDAAHRAEVGQPALPDNTWRLGLHRMLLGYAMQGRGRDLYAGVLAFDEIEGSEAELLGKLAELAERLFRHRLALVAPRTLAAWRDQLTLLLEELVAAGPATAHEHQLIRSALGNLVDASEAAGFAQPIGLRSVQAQLERALDERLPARGLLDRGITFCQLVPMRSIPFKVVCLIGMNDEAFPGKTPRLGFDRMASDPRRPGDRSPRDDDRYMFLEALLSARERLIITYVGRNIQDNRVLPPSVVVDELLDAIDQGFAPLANETTPSAGRRAALEARLCVTERLHAFSPRYFEQGGGADPRLFSYATHYCQGARALAQPRRNPALLEGPLPAADELSALTIDELIAWVTQPIRTFLQQRLGLYLGREIEPLPDREPIDLVGLERWQLGTELLGLALAGVELGKLLPVVRARGVLPLGTVGTLVYRDLAPQVDALATTTLKYRRGSRLDPITVVLDLDGIRLTGTLRDLWPDAHLCASYSKIGRRFELEHFIRHVILSCALQREPRSGYPARSVVVAPNEKGDAISEVELAPVAEPEHALRSLFALARAARNAALPLVYEPARAYADEAVAAAEHGDPDKGLRAARTVFESDPKQHPYAKLLFPSFEALTEDQGELGFVALSHALFEPFFRHRSVA